jgi:CRISPR-associated endonuclease/helicase Cas3
MYYAHTTDDPSKADWQTLADHLKAAAAMAGDFAAPFGAQRAAEMAGLLHDLGKYTAGFQKRLEGGKPVDHATAGAKLAMELAKDRLDRLMAELIAYAIAGHHTGLLDKHNAEASLADRLQKPLELLDPIWQSEIAPEASGLWPRLKPHEDKERAKSHLPFQLGFLGRMIFSCLIDADRRDTQEFYDKAEGVERDRDWHALGDIINGLIGRFDNHMADKQTGARDSDVNRLRAEILAHIRGRAGDGPGLFTLTVPTGGGKTLASLGFALDHAKTHGLRRIVYAIPFTSIVDQTADIFRDVLGKDIVLEHHSAIDEERFRAREGADKLKLAMEDWAAPVIVTTNVQLFESLFAARPSSCRKLHNLARSVIVLDEAQTIPRPYLRPCVAALDELARNYGATVVLCTATQPALDERRFKPGGLRLEDRELAPDPARLAQALRRVRIEFAGEMSDDALIEALGEQHQGLVIVNSRAHALALYRKAIAAGLDGAIHLTTRQYAAHRREILADVRERLKQEQPCRLVATSLVEAGVDLDFPRVWRAEAGLDQIAQAAGRCNREGRRAADDSIVTVFKAEYKPPREIEQLANDFLRMAPNHTDLLSPDAIEAFFGEVYWRMGGEGLDREKILEHFKVDRRDSTTLETSFYYRCVAKKFRLIESGMAPVIIAKDEKAETALKKLQFDGVSPGGVARDLQSYIVQVPPPARNKLIAAQHVTFEREKHFGDQFAVLRTDSLYREGVGLLWEDAEYLSLENSII